MCDEPLTWWEQQINGKELSVRGKRSSSDHLGQVGAKSEGHVMYGCLRGCSIKRRIRDNPSSRRKKTWESRSCGRPLCTFERRAGVARKHTRDHEKTVGLMHAGYGKLSGEMSPSGA